MFESVQSYCTVVDKPKVRLTGVSNTAPATHCVSARVTAGSIAGFGASNSVLTIRANGENAQDVTIQGNGAAKRKDTAASPAHWLKSWKLVSLLPLRK